VKENIFCSHAEEKFNILKKHGFPISRKQILDALNKPDKIENSYGGRYIAQKIIDQDHVIRVVYEKKGRTNLIITFYPGRRNYYED
jgi:hypothetical protein